MLDAAVLGASYTGIHLRGTLLGGGIKSWSLWVHLWCSMNSNSLSVVTGSRILLHTAVSCTKNIYECNKVINIINGSAQTQLNSADHAMILTNVYFIQPTRCNVYNVLYYYQRSTHFGQFFRPSSGAYKTVCAALGIVMISCCLPLVWMGWNDSSNRSTWRYPRLHIQFYKLLMMGRKTARNA